MTLSDTHYISDMDYLTSERSSFEKHEYYRGEVFAMSGASIAHNIVFSNVFGILSSKLKGRNCKPFGSALRIHIPKNTLYTYPDITIVCGKIETLNSSFDTITNPSVIIEILSSSTRDYDKTGKFTLYKDIHSLKEYILIDSESVYVERYICDNNGNWISTEFKVPEQTLLVESVGVSLLLSDIYESIDYN